MLTLIAKYLGPTNTRGSRITITDGDRRVTVPYDHGAVEPYEVALRAFCAKYINVTSKWAFGHTKNGAAFVRVFGDTSDVSRIIEVA